MLPLTVALCAFQATPLESDPSERATFDSKVLWITHAPREGHFGSDIAPMGDLNGDGAFDLLIGSPVDDFPLRDVRGSVSFVTARTGEVYETYVQPKEHWRSGCGDCFPLNSISIGDADGDGVEDALLEIGDPCPLVVRVYTLSGRERRIVSELSRETSHYLGSRSRSVGDSDGDGLGEWISHQQTPTTRIVKRAGLSGHVVAQGPERFFADGPTQFHYPRSIEVIEDVDGDGVRDVLAGGPCVHAPEAWFCFYSGRDLSFLRALHGRTDQSYGFASQGIVHGGDVYLYVSTARGVVFHALSLDGRRARVIASFKQRDLNYHQGFTVVDDLNGDGGADLLVVDGVKHSRRLRALSGCDGSPLGSTVELPSISDIYRTTIWNFVNVGDVDGDGRAEVALMIAAGDDDLEEDVITAVCLLQLRPRAQ